MVLEYLLGTRYQYVVIAASRVNPYLYAPWFDVDLILLILDYGPTSGGAVHPVICVAVPSCRRIR